MKNKQILKELKEKDDKALYKDLKDEYLKLANLEFKAGFKKLKNVHEITASRKKIARIWTIINQRLEEKIKKDRQ